MSTVGGDLTRREYEVVRLVGRGYTNRRIAEELVITQGTAANHVANILGKLGVSNRAQVAAWISSRQMTPGAAGSARRQHHETVLVVEDDRCLRQLLVEILQDEGYTVVAAADGADAVRLLNAAVPDAALLDLELPSGSGLEILRFLDLAEATRRVPVFVVSGQAEPVWAAGSAPRPRGFVAKPFDLPTLLGYLEEAIDHHSECRTPPREDAA